MRHEINVSEIIAGNYFITIYDGLKLYNEIRRLWSSEDEYLIDFLGISRISRGALLNSIGKLVDDDNANLDQIKCINTNIKQDKKIKRFYNKLKELKLCQD